MAIPAIGQVNMTTLPSFLNLARTNLYQVYITPQWGANGTTEQPFLKHLREGASRYGVINFESDFSNILGLLCSEATIPTSSYATAEVKDNFMGVSQEFAHTRINTDIDFTFYIDREYKVLGFFEAWMDYISGGNKDVAITDANALQLGNYYRRFNYPNHYKNRSGIYIKKFEKDWQTSNAPNISFQLINAFPKSVSSLSVSYGESEVLKVTVTMNYDRYIARREYADVTSDQRTFQQSIDPSTSKGDIRGTKTVGQSGAGTFEDLNRANETLGQA